MQWVKVAKVDAIGLLKGCVDWRSCNEHPPVLREGREKVGKLSFATLLHTPRMAGNTAIRRLRYLKYDANTRCMYVVAHTHTNLVLVDDVKTRSSCFSCFSQRGYLSSQYCRHCCNASGATRDSSDQALHILRSIIITRILFFNFLQIHWYAMVRVCV